MREKELRMVTNIKIHLKCFTHLIGCCGSEVGEIKLTCFVLGPHLTLFKVYL